VPVLVIKFVFGRLLSFRVRLFDNCGSLFGVFLLYRPILRKDFSRLFVCHLLLLLLAYPLIAN
jgi:hypothetical protein